MFHLSSIRYSIVFHGVPNAPKLPTPHFQATISTTDRKENFIMAPPLGNKFWEARSSHGRNPKFATADDLWQACCEYFSWVEDHPLIEAKPFAFQGQSWIEDVPKMRAMTFDGLHIFLDITDQTWHNYKNRGEDFLDVINRAEKIMRNQKFTGAAADLLNPNIIARDLGLKENVSNEHTSPDGSMTPRSLDQSLVQALVDKLVD